MLQEESINLGSLLLSMSDAIDLVSSTLASHQQRTAYVSWEIAKAIGMPEEQTERLFAAALLHDVGALSSKEKIAIQRSWLGDPSPHCRRGEVLFRTVPWLAPAARIVRLHHTPWKDIQEPLEAPDVLEAQVLKLADTLERSIDRRRYILHQDEALRAKIESRSGSRLHPEVVDAFLAASGREEFWLDLASPNLHAILRDRGPYRRLHIKLEELESLSLFFRNIIDFRSRFTATHSSGVAECAATVARLFGLAEHDVRLMAVAGNLHDLGKLVIPESILEKPGRLTDEEFAVMRQHTYWTYAVLKAIGGLDRIAEWAAFHHEKLDGTGYPFHLGADRLDSGARIMAVADIFTALAEDRPYRPGMDQEGVADILLQKADAGFLERNIVHLVLDHYAEIAERVRAEQAAARALYEQRFARPEELEKAA